jgi:hypothetical protein
MEVTSLDNGMSWLRGELNERLVRLMRSIPTIPLTVCDVHLRTQDHAKMLL